MLREKFGTCEHDERSVREQAPRCCPACGQQLNVQMRPFRDADEADLAELREEVLDFMLFADDVEGEPE
jgi:hypothetical protein